MSQHSDRVMGGRHEDLSKEHITRNVHEGQKFSSRCTGHRIHNNYETLPEKQLSAQIKDC